MNFGIIFCMRLGSSRLPRKQLLPACGKPLAHYLLERMLEEFKPEVEHDGLQIVIASTPHEENKAFEQFQSGVISVFYGSEENIPLRHLQAAKKFNIDKILWIDGDDFLFSRQGLRLCYDALCEDAQYVKTANTPFGMEGGGYTTDFLEKSLIGFHEEILDTGWHRIFNEECLVEVSLPFGEVRDDLRLTLDYEEDYQLVRKVIELQQDRIYSASDEDIINCIIDNKLYELNRNRIDEYWERFYREQENDIGYTRLKLRRNPNAA